MADFSLHIPVITLDVDDLIIPVKRSRANIIKHAVTIGPSPWAGLHTWAFISEK